MKRKGGLFLIILVITIRAGLAQVEERIEYPNLVKNGNFESGATGFKSDFIYSDTSFNPGYYIITENINQYIGSDFLNPVPNTGKYFAINVNNSGKQRLWYDSITVKPNTTYSFSCNLANINADLAAPGVMSLQVNGKKIHPSQTLSNGSVAWTPFSIKYKSGPDETRIEISIVDLIWTLQGNDVALDNIVFQEIPPEEFIRTKDYSNYSIQISKSPLPLVLNEIVLKKPFNKKNPVSYSVIYWDRLITLFEQGDFICQSTLTFDRDTEFEKYLNTRNFQYHWLLNNKLVGLSNNKYYFLNTENVWVEYKNEIPFSNQPKLFEDNNYICFRDCQWGGTVYFFNKHTKKTHFTNATCVNSIIKRENKYYVLSNLAKREHSVFTIGHLGCAYLKEITNPDNLPIVELNQGQGLVCKERSLDRSNIANLIFSYYNIEILASFIYNEKTIYLVNWHEETFLAEIENSVIKVVNPLFNKEFYTHNPVTTSYDNTILINFDFYGIARDREAFCIIIKDGKLTKLDWNEK
jgi:hypothetical protein